MTGAIVVKDWLGTVVEGGIGVHGGCQFTWLVAIGGSMMGLERESGLIEDHGRS